MASDHKTTRRIGGTRDGGQAGDARREHLLIEPSLFYDPPYERPLEDEFAWHLVKYLNPVTALDYQVRVETPCTPVWIDFVVELGGRRIGFELGELDEGAADEAGAPARRFREALVLGGGGVDVLYRFRARDVLHRLHDGLYAAAQWDAELFSARGHVNLRTLASSEAREQRPRLQETELRVAYAPREELRGGDAFTWPSEEGLEMVVRRLSRENPAAWMRDYDEALAHYGTDDDDLGRRWAKSA